MSHISHFEEQERAEEEARRRHQTLSMSVRRGAPGAGAGNGGVASEMAANAQQVAGVDEPSIWNFYAGGGKTPNSRFLTRYQPYSRRISFQPTDFQVELEDDDHKEALQQLVHHSWRLFRLSPLIGFDASADVLKSWSDSLQTDLRQSLARTPSTEPQQAYQKIHVSAELVPGLRGADHDSPAVRIVVSTRQKKTVLLTAFLLSVDRHDKLAMDEELQTAILPVMLISGVEAIASIVRENIQKCFDCVISSVWLSQSELRWAAAMWVGMKMADEGEEEEVGGRERMVKFVYALPNSGEKLDLELKQSQIYSLWKSIHEATDNTAMLLEIEAFHQALTKHVNDSVGMNLESLKLEKIEVPAARLESHKIQIESARHAKSILRFLTDVCQLDLDSVVPRIGITTGDTIML